jgi:hypothetical protein
MAAGLKAHQLATDPFVTFSPLPLGEGRVRALAPLLHSRPFLIGIVECELLFGLVLLSGIFGKGDRSNLPERPNGCFAQIGSVPFSEPRLTWALSLLCFSGFALISLYKGISGYSTCGCFGRVPVSPWYTFALDAAAVLALLRWRPRGSSRFHVATFARSAAVLAVWLLVGTPVALGTWTEPVGTLTDLGEALPDGKTILLKPETWIGKRFPLLPYIDIGDRLADGDWIVVLYRRDCPKCQEAISKSERRREDIVAGRRLVPLAFVEIEPLESETRRSPSERQTAASGRLKKPMDWFIVTPCVVRLSDGIVSGSNHGEVSNDG